RLAPRKAPHGPAGPEIFHPHPDQGKNPEGGYLQTPLNEEAEQENRREIEGENEGQDKKQQQGNGGAQMAEGVDGRVEQIVGSQIEQNSEKKDEPKPLPHPLPSQGPKERHEGDEGEQA